MSKIENEKSQINEDEELGSTLKELTKPENLIGPFKTTEELMASLWDDDDE